MGIKQPASHIAMPIAIVLGIFLALFTLSIKAKQHTGKHPEEVVIVGGKNLNWMEKKDNRDIGSFNIFQQAFMFRMEENESMEERQTSNKSLNSNIQRVVCLSVK